MSKQEAAEEIRKIIERVFRKPGLAHVVWLLLKDNA